MTDKREEAKTPPGNLQRLAAALDAVDGELAKLNAAQMSGDSGESARIEEARALLRRAIRTLVPEAPIPEALAPKAPLEAAEETGSGKRRVRIKAESEIATPIAAVDSPSKPNASTAKPPSRGARAGRRAASAEKASRGSLIARLGAAADAAVPAPAKEAATVPAEPAGPDKTLTGTAERLAQLEAEIADLTDRVTAAPAADHAPAQSPLAAHEPAAGARPDAQGFAGDEDDEDDAEITIIGADGAPVASATRNGRQAPRIFRESTPPVGEEEAEVEIRGSGVAPAGGRGADRPGTVRVSARTTAATGRNNPRSKWRLFGGSS